VGYKERKRFLNHIKYWNREDHKSKEAKKTKRNMVDDLGISLYTRDCYKENCIRNWTPIELSNYLQLTIDNNEMEKVIELLLNLEVGEQNKASHIISGRYYHLKAHGKTACPKEYAWLHNIGESKLRGLVGEIHPSPETSNMDSIPTKERVLDKKYQSIAFLKYIYESEIYSDPIPSTEYRRISYLNDRFGAYSFFMTGFSNGVHGDFEGLVGINWNNPPSFKYFQDIWKQYYPYLLTESDVPQCDICMNFKKQEINALKDNNFAEQQRIKEIARNHKATAKNLTD